MKTKLLVTGSTGLVGSRFVQIFKNKFSISSIGRENVNHKINLLSEKDVVGHVTSSDADAVVNFAAYTNVDGVEEENGQKSGEVYLLNAMLPYWLAKACKASGKSLYHISTDYVFSGKKADKPYNEEDIARPLNSWYSITKFEGELSVKRGFGDEEHGAIIRISFPYSAIYDRKLDFARVIINKLSQGETYFGITNQKIKPTSVEDIVHALGLLIKKNAHGIYHIAGKFEKEGFISPYDFAKKLAKIMKLDSSQIKPISFQEMSKKRISPKPQHTWLDTKKIESMGLDTPDIDEALKRFKKQFNL